MESNKRKEFTPKKEEKSVNKKRPVEDVNLKRKLSISLEIRQGNVSD